MAFVQKAGTQMIGKTGDVVRIFLGAAGELAINQGKRPRPTSIAQLASCNLSFPSSPLSSNTARDGTTSMLATNISRTEIAPLKPKSRITSVSVITSDRNATDVVVVVRTQAGPTLL